MDKKILIYGMGKTGKAVKKFCENNKIKYFTFDDNTDKRKRQLIAQTLPEGITQSMIPKYVCYYNECYNKEKNLYFMMF